MLELDDQQQAARDWFESLRDRICAAFEEIEREAGSTPPSPTRRGTAPTPAAGPAAAASAGRWPARYSRRSASTSRPSAAGSAPSSPKSIPGAAEDPSFFATGISLVAHMANPHVPAVHMNTRFLTTTRRWFGGGADLNPAIPYEEDTEAFHARFRAACAAHDPTFYPRFSKWAEEYFWLPHRGVARGVGGIFYDYLEDHFDEHFAFTRDVGEAFLDIVPQLVRKRMETPFDRRRHGPPPRIPRPLRRVQPPLRPRHPVRPQDRRQRRRDPDEPAAAGEVEMSYELSPADGELAAVVTYLEMRSPADQPNVWSPLSLNRIEVPQPEHYRELFRLVGAPWLWFSRLTLDDAHLAEIVQHPKVELYSVLDENGRDVGMLELDFREPHECELAFIGLIPELSGKGHGRWLLAEAVRPRLARRRRAGSTSTLARSIIRRRSPPIAAPASSPTSARSSVSPIRAFSGILPRDCAPQVPLLGTEG